MMSWPLLANMQPYIYSQTQELFCSLSIVNVSAWSRYLIIHVLLYGTVTGQKQAAPLVFTDIQR